MCEVVQPKINILKISDTNYAFQSQLTFLIQAALTEMLNINVCLKDRRFSVIRMFWEAETSDT